MKNLSNLKFNDLFTDSSNKLISPKKLLKKNPFILAPMDDVTDIAFRELCCENGASYSTSELTSVDALIRDKVYNTRYSRGNLKVNSVQFFGSKPDLFLKAAKFVGDEADIIDVNFGCPSACVNANDSGAILLKDPKNVGKIIEKLVKYVNKPITAKIRLGYDKTTYLDVAREVEDAGAEVIAVHGRTAKQKYSGKANWDAIAEIYSSLKIPVIGNGDIINEDDIDTYLGSHCDALMIGRAAIGNPFIFKRFNHYYKTGKKIPFDLDLNLESDLSKKQIQKNLFMNYLKKLENRNFKNINVKIQRQAMWFMKGISGAKKLRMNLLKEKDIKKIIDLVENF